MRLSFSVAELQVIVKEYVQEHFPEQKIESVGFAVDPVDPEHGQLTALVQFTELKPVPLQP